MADVKFMDLSQNDNPATTDSVLIGNSTDGLKRTSVGTIGKLFSVKGLFHYERIGGKNDPTNVDTKLRNSVPIAAPDVPGYNFAFWLSASTLGTIGGCYVEFPNAPQTNVFLNVPHELETPIKINAIAVYVNSTVA